LHTSDWHLGQRLLGESREDEHREFLRWLIELINSKEIDALIVAGDIFDTATPPSYARRLYNDFLAEFAKSNSPNLIIIGGNHDSASVLNEEQKLLRELNIFVVGGYEESIKDIVIPIRDRFGELKGVVGAVAYLKEVDLRDSSKPTDINSRAKELERAIASYYQRVFNECKRVSSELPVVATGHLSTLKILESEAVRDIYIGSLEIFNKELFPPFDYIALGHYHKFTKMKNICYSGSPIALSFDESNDEKVVLEVEVESGSLDIKKILVPNFRRLHRLSGDIKSLKEALKSIKVDSTLSLDWVELEIEPKGLETLSSAIEELKEVNLELKIIKNVVKSSQINSLSQIEQKSIELKELTPLRVFQQRLDLDETLSKEDKDELILTFKMILEELDEDIKA
jgi:exonuclease SbcD